MKKLYWIILGMVAVLLIIGTFADINIAEFLYNPDSAFGHFFAVIGMIPMWFLVPIAAGMMFGALIIQFPNLSVTKRVIYIIIQIFGVFATYMRTAEFPGSRHLHGLPFEALVILVIVFFLLAAALGAYASKRFPDEVMTAAVIGIISVAGGRLLLDVFKSVWGRHRFRFMDDIANQFTPWFSPQFPDAERREFMGDMIKSFPSGHSYAGITMLWLSMFPPFLGFCQKHLKRFIIGTSVFAVCFWLCSMSSRLFLGEHFLSDVSVSALMFLLFFIISDIIVTKLRAGNSRAET